MAFYVREKNSIPRDLEEKNSYASHTPRQESNGRP